LILTAVLPDAAEAQPPAEAGTQKVAIARPDAAPEALLRYEPTGLSLLRPYARGKVPVVLVHGLWVSPSSWHRMVEALEADPVLRDRYQFWTFGYSTGDPIPYSAYLMRLDLDEARRTLDPERSDAAFDRMVIVGHSMGGLLAKMMAVDSGDRLWRVITDRPFGELQGDPQDLDLFRSGLIFGPRPEVRRVIFIATPHRGSTLDRGRIQRMGTHLVRVPDPLEAAHRRLVERNAASFFRDHFRKGLPSSIDELEWGSPMLMGLSDLPISPAIAASSIIAVRADSPPGIRTDGLVSFESASLAGVASEKVIATGHLCQDHPEVIAEIRRILAEGTGLDREH
jgi:pimeloyl-ACP methyl ester carboxylesterase